MKSRIELNNRVPTPNMRCDGEVIFGFTVKACDKPATRYVRESNHEEYWFCAEHYFFYYHGSEHSQAQSPKRKAD